MTEQAAPSATTEVVMVDGKGVGLTIRRNDFEVEAVLWRPKAESDKGLGIFKSRRKARRAVEEAARARQS
jgi:hypothetical protein